MLSNLTKSDKFGPFCVFPKMIMIMIIITAPSRRLTILIVRGFEEKWAIFQISIDENAIKSKKYDM